MTLKVVMDAIDFKEFESEISAITEKIFESEKKRLYEHLENVNSETNEILLIEQTKQNLLVISSVVSMKIQEQILKFVEDTDKKLAETILKEEKYE